MSDKYEIVKHKDSESTNSIIRKCVIDNLPAQKLYNSEKSLRQTSKDYTDGEILVKSALLRMLIALNYFAYGNNTLKYMSEEQAAEISNTLYRTFGDFNIKEVNYIFQGLKTGKYGKLYGNYSGNFIAEAFQTYRKERSKYITESQQNDFQERLKAMETPEAKKRFFGAYMKHKERMKNVVEPVVCKIEKNFGKFFNLNLKPEKK